MKFYLINDILIQVKFVENPCLQNWWASMRSSLLSALPWLSSTVLQSTAAFFSASWTFPKTNKLKLLFPLFNSSLVDFFANFQRIFANYSALTVKILSKAVSYSNSTDIQLFFNYRSLTKKGAFSWLWNLAIVFASANPSFKFHLQLSCFYWTFNTIQTSQELVLFISVIFLWDLRICSHTVNIFVMHFGGLTQEFFIFFS